MVPVEGFPMNDTALPKSKRKTAADYQAVAAQLLTEINRLEEQMDRDHAESERLKVETQVIMARTETTLSRLQEQIDRLSKAV